MSPVDYDWSGFYRVLNVHGPALLTGLGPSERELVAEIAGTEDTFWSDGLQDLLAAGAAAGDLRSGVLAAVELWRENVLAELTEDIGLEIEWASVTVDEGSPLIDALVAAATPDGEGRQ